MAIWKQKASSWTFSQMELPRPYDIRATSAVYLNDELYIIGGDKPFFKLDRNMECIHLADMNEERYWINNSCLEWNGYIWVFGGWHSTERYHLKSVERYDPKNKWTRMP